ncbi:interaptin-like isoform X2 [Ptychodera flava]|uniref:interaptin-like isoform X2 n=1 Tax=Ptychodera flava TaxID=63121 RepID=UPI00396A164D
MGNKTSKHIATLDARLKQLEELVLGAERYYLANVRIQKKEKDGFVDVDLIPQATPDVVPGDDIHTDAVPFHGPPVPRNNVLPSGQQNNRPPTRVPVVSQATTGQGDAPAEQKSQQPGSNLGQQSVPYGHCPQADEQQPSKCSISEKEQNAICHVPILKESIQRQSNTHSLKQPQQQRQLYSDYIGPNLAYNGMLTDICKGMTERDLANVKMLIKPDPVTDSQRSIPSSFLEQITTPQELLTQLERQLLLSPLNLFFLQFLMIRIDRRDLHDIIYKFGKNRGNTLRFFVATRPQEDGWIYVNFHFEGSLSHFDMNDIDEFRGYLQQELGIPLEYINVSGIQAGSVIVTYQLPQICSPNVRTMIEEGKFSEKFKVKAVQIEGQDLVTFDLPDLKRHKSYSESDVSDKTSRVEGTQEPAACSRDKEECHVKALKDADARVHQLQIQLKRLIDISLQQQKESEEECKNLIQQAVEEVETSKEKEKVLEARLEKMSANLIKQKENLLQLERQKAEDADTIQTLKFEKEKLKRENIEMKAKYKGHQPFQSLSDVKSEDITKEKASTVSKGRRWFQFSSKRTNSELEHLKVENEELRRACSARDEKLRKLEEQITYDRDQAQLKGISKIDRIREMSEVVRERQVVEVRFMMNQTRRLIEIVKELNIEMQYHDEEESRGFDQDLKAKIVGLVTVCQMLTHIQQWLDLNEMQPSSGKKFRENQSIPDNDNPVNIEKLTSAAGELVEPTSDNATDTHESKPHEGHEVTLDTFEMQSVKTTGPPSNSADTSETRPSRIKTQPTPPQQGHSDSVLEQKEDGTGQTERAVAHKLEGNAKFSKFSPGPAQDQPDKKKEREPQFMDPFIMALSNVLNAMNVTPSLFERSYSGSGSTSMHSFNSMLSSIDEAAALPASDPFGLTCSHSESLSGGTTAVPFAAPHSPSLHSTWHGSPGSHPASSPPTPITESVELSKEIPVNVHMLSENDDESDSTPKWTLCFQTGKTFQKLVKMIGNMVFREMDINSFTVIDDGNRSLELTTVIEESESAVNVTVVPTTKYNGDWIWLLDRNDGICYVYKRDKGKKPLHPRASSLMVSDKRKVAANTKFTDLPLQLIRRICYKLNANQKDWKNLARAIGKSQQQIQVYSKENDPCFKMLRDWANRDNATIGRLVDALRSPAVNRPDIADEIDKN